MDPSLKALTAQKAALESEISSLQAKLSRVVAAIDALTAGDLFDDMKAAYQRRRRMPGTLKQMAFTVLHEAKKPLTAQEVIAQIEEKFGVSVERTSMSPQLSRLSQDLILNRSGNLWAVNPDRYPEADQFYLLASEGDLI